ncbi:MAG: hypothetical protein GY851_34950 [bacterium]|nr:hypothetical protein [bacterium]
MKGTGGTLLYQYDYTYDDGDNMLTKAIYDAGLGTTETTTFTYDVEEMGTVTIC